MPVLLDTHVWVWWLSGDSRLSRRERDALDRLAERGELRLSAISLWEVQMAYAKKRFQPEDPFEVWLRAATQPDIVQLVPIDASVAMALNSLPAGFHNDPADRLIVATSRVHALSLATHDSTIRKSRTVRLWRP
ncbi:MAG: type II toxin-antitoxin system VapC family toxin [Betaproteobacteria bacterium]|nr:type II toxin-antitoxin system VapC family toxin [Betaproteobacteria bacterium]